MDEILRSLDFTFAYIAEILIASSSDIEHMLHMGTLFQRLQHYGVVVVGSKCIFG